MTHSPWLPLPYPPINEHCPQIELSRMDLARHFGAAVRHHRLLVRISQEELAERAGKDRTYVSGIERGSRNPSLSVMQSLSDALGADLDVIFATARQLALRQKSRS